MIDPAYEARLDAFEERLVEVEHRFCDLICRLRKLARDAKRYAKGKA
jgi:hypothetical protein